MSVQSDNFDREELIEKVIGTNLKYKHEINWVAVKVLLVIHILAIWGFILVCKGEVKSSTLIWSVFLAVMSKIGSSVAAHRFFTHKSFKASFVLEVILLIMQTLSGELHLFTWCRDHRQHHRFSDTDADPINAKRGFLFAYLGWVITKRNKYVLEICKRINMQDLISNKLVMFQKRYYLQLFLIISVILPALIAVLFFDESWKNSLLVAYALRHVFHLHFTWFTVGLGHVYGTRPYDKNIQPVESMMVSVVTGGDGNHNFHHAFPWDYKSSEKHNFMSMFIYICGFLRLAYDLKAATRKMVQEKIRKSGDGTHHRYGTEEGKANIIAVGPLYPLNPTYRNKSDPEVSMKVRGSKIVFSTDLDEGNG